MPPPSFDIVSEVDEQQLANGVDQAARIVANRFDFKNAQASFEREGRQVTLRAVEEFHLEQMLDILSQRLGKCGIDTAALEVGASSAGGGMFRQTAVLKHGIDSDFAKEIVKRIKEMKLKVQPQVQGEQIRVTGKKRDDLQQSIAAVREAQFDQPLQFVNFRD